MKLQDRKKERREYLKERGIVAGSIVVYASILIVFSNIVWLLACGMLFDPIGTRDNEVLLSIVLILLFAGVIVGCCKGIQAANVRYQATPYVPPVKPDNLPAEEVLVRSSEEPPVKPSDVLLRAAKGQQTASEELLRASNEK